MKALHLENQFKDTRTPIGIGKDKNERSHKAITLGRTNTTQKQNKQKKLDQHPIDSEESHFVLQ